MSQIVNILRKDIRGLRVEILLVLAGTIAFVWVRRPDWLPTDQFAMITMPHLNYSMEELLQVLRCLLIARVVHKESLAGNRQFWITRPYSWRQLLAAKSLFIGLFAVVPSAIADCALLRFAGFSALAYVPQLIGHQALLAALFLAPFFAIATVTRNLWQFAAPSICLFAFWFLLIRPQPEVSEWFRFPLILAIVIAGALITIVLQYARRRVAAARLVMIGAVAAVAAVSLLPLPDAAVSLRYSAEQTPVTIAFDPAPFKIDANYPSGIWIPLKIAGIPENWECQLDGARVLISAPGGTTSNSGWQRANLFLDDNKTGGTLNAYVDLRDFDVLKWVRANVRVTVALTLLHPRNVLISTLQESPVAIPDVGNCWWYYGGPMDLRCLTPFRSPLPLISGATKFGPDCLIASRPIPPFALKLAQALLMEGGRPGLRLAFRSGYLENTSLNPVVVDFIRIGSSGRGAATETLCAGTEVVVTTLRPGARILRDIDIHDIRLVDYWPKYAR